MAERRAFCSFGKLTPEGFRDKEFVAQCVALRLDTSGGVHHISMISDVSADNTNFSYPNSTNMSAGLETWNNAILTFIVFTLAWSTSLKA